MLADRPNVRCSNCEDSLRYHCDVLSCVIITIDYSACVSTWVSRKGVIKYNLLTYLLTSTCVLLVNYRFCLSPLLQEMRTLSCTTHNNARENKMIVCLFKYRTIYPVFYSTGLENNVASWRLTSNYSLLVLLLYSLKCSVVYICLFTKYHLIWDSRCTCWYRRMTHFNNFFRLLFQMITYRGPTLVWVFV